MTPLEIDTGTTAWLLASAALVLLMTPGLALLYGGMTCIAGVLGYEYGSELVHRNNLVLL